MNVPEERYREIAARIADERSPVGIDAEKTHVMIVYMLEEIERRLARLEREVGGAAP